ncbi:hypothetical protein AB6A40_000811 [Gnathostoma spinigerum]|uniref:Small EDRK-rich factor-like N-terminal domain-containing protein n=1 Tax=Gnathostoma spinigerum TaxID=75299 RepID=A0ABD6EBP3_9BILA
MTRGNQRELAREKNLKKQLQMKKQKGAAASEGNQGVKLDSRMERDADIMRKKQEAAAAKKAAIEAASSGGQKKVQKFDPLK